jgi:hypothetical protein
MADTLKEKNEAKWSKGIKKIRNDFYTGKIDWNQFSNLWDALDKEYPSVASKHRTIWRETKMFKQDLEKKKEKIRKKEFKDGHQ